MIQQMDLQIGRVLQALDAHGMAAQTIVIFTSDNGGERYADTWPFTGRKMELLEGGLRIPAVLRSPGHVPPGPAPDPPHPSDGMKLLPWLTEASAPVPRQLFWRYTYNDQHAARDGDWNYLKTLDQTFLFDVAQDPMERANLKVRHKDVYARLVVAWHAWNATMLPLDP